MLCSCKDVTVSWAEVTMKERSFFAAGILKCLTAATRTLQVQRHSCLSVQQENIWRRQVLAEMML